MRKIIYTFFDDTLIEYELGDKNFRYLGENEDQVKIIECIGSIYVPIGLRYVYPNLQQITVDNDIINQVAGNLLLSEDGKSITMAMDNSLTELVIPEGVEFISAYAFKNCSNLAGIVDLRGIPAMLGYLSFYGTNIEKVIINSNCLNGGYYTFDHDFTIEIYDNVLISGFVCEANVSISLIIHGSILGNPYYLINSSISIKSIIIDSDFAEVQFPITRTTESITFTDKANAIQLLNVACCTLEIFDQTKWKSHNLDIVFPNIPNIYLYMDSWSIDHELFLKKLSFLPKTKIIVPGANNLYIGKHFDEIFTYDINMLKWALLCRRLTLPSWPNNMDYIDYTGRYSTSLNDKSAYTEIRPKGKYLSTLVNESDDWVDLGLPFLIAKCNLGASSPEEYGNYYKPGRLIPDLYYVEGGISIIKGDASSDPVTNELGSLYSTLSYTEWELIQRTCFFVAGSYEGTYGVYIISLRNGNAIFMPASGFKYYSDKGGTLYEERSYSYFLLSDSLNNGGCIRPKDLNIFTNKYSASYLPVRGVLEKEQYLRGQIIFSQAVKDSVGNEITEFFGSSETIYPKDGNSTFAIKELGNYYTSRGTIANFCENAEYTVVYPTKDWVIQENLYTAPEVDTRLTIKNETSDFLWYKLTKVKGKNLYITYSGVYNLNLVYNCEVIVPPDGEFCIYKTRSEYIDEEETLYIISKYSTLATLYNSKYESEHEDLSQNCLFAYNPQIIVKTKEGIVIDPSKSYKMPIGYILYYEAYLNGKTKPFYSSFVEIEANKSYYNLFVDLNDIDVDPYPTLTLLIPDDALAIINGDEVNTKTDVLGNFHYEINYAGNKIEDDATILIDTYIPYNLLVMTIDNSPRLYLSINGNDIGNDSSYLLLINEGDAYTIEVNRYNINYRYTPMLIPIPYTSSDIYVNIADKYSKITINSEFDDIIITSNAHFGNLNDKLTITYPFTCYGMSSNNPATWVYKLHRDGDHTYKEYNRTIWASLSDLVINVEIEEWKFYTINIQQPSGATITVNGATDSLTLREDESFTVTITPNSSIFKIEQVNIGSTLYNPNVKEEVSYTINGLDSNIIVSALVTGGTPCPSFTKEITNTTTGSKVPVTIYYTYSDSKQVSASSNTSNSFSASTPYILFWINDVDTLGVSNFLMTGHSNVWYDQRANFVVYKIIGSATNIATTGPIIPVLIVEIGQWDNHVFAIGSNKAIIWGVYLKTSEPTSRTPEQFFNSVITSKQVCFS